MERYKHLKILLYLVAVLLLINLTTMLIQTQQTSAYAQQKKRYKAIIRLKSGEQGRDPELEKFLTKENQGGWELVSFNGDNYINTYIFSR